MNDRRPWWLRVLGGVGALVLLAAAWHVAGESWRWFPLGVAVAAGGAWTFNLCRDQIDRLT